MSLLGIGAIITILISLGGALDSFDKTLARSRAETVRGNPYRMVATLTTMLPRDGETVQAVRRSPLIESAEPTLMLAATVRSGGRTIETSLEVLDPASTVWRPRVTSGTFTTRTGGIVISNRAARDLRVHVGDTLTLEHPVRTGLSSFRSATTRVRVAALHPNPLRSLAYMNDRLAPLYGLRGVANTLELRLAPNTRQAAVTRAFFATPGIASVEPVAAIPDALHRFLHDFLGFLRVTQTITLLLALLIAFNATSIAGDERRREHATMFAFGLPIRSVMTGSVVESALIGILGTIAGIGAGLLVLGWVINVVTAEVFPDLGTVVSLSPATIAVAVLLGVGAVALAPLLGTRRLLRMDLPSTLRVAE